MLLRIHICGHDKSAPTAANGLRKCCWRIAITWRTPTKYTQNTPQNTNKHSVKYQRSPTKWGANTPLGVGADSSRPYPNIIKYVYSHYWIRVFTSSHTHFHIIKYVYSRHQIRVSVSTHTHIHIINYVFLHHQIHISISPNTYIHIIEYVYSRHQIRFFTPPHAHYRLSFCGCFHICGRDKSVPYGCERFAKMLLTDCDNATNTPWKNHEHQRNTHKTLRKIPTNIPWNTNAHPRNWLRTLRQA